MGHRAGWIFFGKLPEGAPGFFVPKRVKHRNRAIKFYLAGGFARYREPYLSDFRVFGRFVSMLSVQNKMLAEQEGQAYYEK